MNLRSTLRKAAGLLVEMPPEPELDLPELPVEEGSETHRKAISEVERIYQTLEVGSRQPAAAPAKTVEQIVRESDGPNLDQIQMPAVPPVPILNADGSVNFPAIYQAASLPPVPFTAEQVLEVMNSLPSELPVETKRQTVRVSITSMGKSIGASPENIVADASRKLASLAAYADNLTQQTSQLTAAAELEILRLEAQIEEKRRLITSASEKLAQITEKCAAESDRLDDVLEFFSLDVPPSKYASGRGS